MTTHIEYLNWRVARLVGGKSVHVSMCLCEGRCMYTYKVMH